MAFYYQNQNAFPVSVPTATGITLTLFRGEVVEGEPYSIFEKDGILTRVEGPYTYPTLRYSWYGSITPGGSGTITGITAVSPITGGGTSGNISIGLGLESITADYIAPGTITGALIGDGQVVKGLKLGSDTFTDVIELLEGDNIALTFDSLANSLTIGTALGVVTSVTADAPIFVNTVNNVANLSLDVTPTLSGGAVALQNFIYPAVYQDGYAALGGLMLEADASKPVVDTSTAAVSLFDKDNSLYRLGVHQSGNIHTNGNFATAQSHIGKTLSLYETTAFSQTLLEVEATDKWIQLSSDPNVASYFDVDVTLKSALTLGTVSVRDADTFGRITGIHGATNPTPLISLVSESTNNVTPIIKVSAATAYPNITGTTAFGYQDVNNDYLVKIYNNGQIDAKELNADVINAGVIHTDYEVHSNILLSAGNYVITDYPGVNTFIFNSTAGVTSVNLPELNANSINGQTYIFKKYDITTNGVIIIPAVGQTIDNTLTQYTLSTAGQFVRLQAVIITAPIPAYFWITC